MSDNIAAHCIVYNGIRHRLSVASLDARGRIVISPLTEERPNTRFVNGAVAVKVENGVICATPCSIE